MNAERWWVSMQHTCGRIQTDAHCFSFLAAGDDWVLPLATTGDSTIETPSPAEPSSEDAVPEAVVSRLFARLARAIVELAPSTVRLAPSRILHIASVLGTVVGGIAVGGSADGRDTAARENQP